MKTLAIGIAMIVGGFWLKSHYEPIVQMCNSGFGTFAQAVSSSANSDCSTASSAVTASPWLIGIGFVLAIGSGLAMLGLLTALGIDMKKTRGRKPVAKK